MGKLITINIFLAGLVIVAALSSFRIAYDNLQTYGWLYNQTTINESPGAVALETTTVSVGVEMVSSLLAGAMGMVFLMNNHRLRNSLTLEILPHDEDEHTGITFPLGDPEKWDLSVDLKTRAISVMLNGVQIDFPLSKILGWVDEHEKKMEDAK